MRALLLLACLAACDTGDAPSATLVAHYAMDDVDGNRATDSSGNDHHGMCTTCPALVAGKKGMAYSFDGGDQQVDVIENPAFTLERGMSVAAWVKVDAMPATIPGCAAVKGAAWSLCIGTDLKPNFGADMGSSPIALGAWTHLAISWDGNLKKIYVNGAEAFSQAIDIMPDTTDIAFGAELVGAVDELAIYSSALSSDQVKALQTP